MSVRRPPVIALLLALSGLAGCSGGGKGVATASFSCVGTDPRAICLQACNLGCTSTGCARTDIAQNEIIILQFSEAIDPSTVNPSSIRFRTASGEQPVGEFFVNGNQVEFVPTLAISGGQTFFGFASGETYTMTIPGGESQPAVVRSLSGKPFERTLTCTLQSRLGIVDLNGVAPRAVMVSPPPSQLASAPRDVEIVLEFNEMIDATPFLSGSQSPISFAVRRTREGFGGARECDPNSQLLTLNGSVRVDFDAARGISTVSFSPAQTLPGNICVEINTTDQVADLSGRSATPQTFSFLTEVVPLTETSRTEHFDDDAFLDIDASASQWGGGEATFARIGGDGRHGPFSLSFCTDTNTFVDGKRVYTLNTDGTTIPAGNTTTGNPIQVTNGRFFFTTFVLPADARLSFVGTNPPIFTVSGRIDVSGDIDVSGSSILAMPVSTTIPGQPGAAGGIFGGSGGKGGDKITSSQATTTGATAANQGAAGQDARVFAGHAYLASTVGSGGRGSTVFPASGLNADIYYGTSSPTLAYGLSAVAGGGGGGLRQTGTQGYVVSNNHNDGITARVTGAATTSLTSANANWTPGAFVNRTVTINTGASGAGQVRTISGNTEDTLTVTAAWAPLPQINAWFTIRTAVPAPAPLLSQMGPPAPGGQAVQLFPFPAAQGTITRASEHFLVGGSGGGGAASQACLSLGLASQLDRWAPGSGGGGGGGVFALRAGDSLRLAPSARLFSRGGNGASSSGIGSNGQPAPGGGGSGGSIVLQSGRLIDISGSIDVRGGNGGVFQRNSNPATPPAGVQVRIDGGNGSPGFVRLEGPAAPPLSQLATMQPAATTDNVGALSEVDSLVGCRSKFYSTGLLFGPEFARYEIYGHVDGAPFVLSDDPAVAALPAQDGAPVRALWQGANLDLVTGVPMSLGPWRTSVRTAGTQVGIASDGLNGYRFLLLVDYALGAVITIDRVVVVYRI